MPDEGSHRDDLFSKSIRAGKRTYFFDVKTTRSNDLYMTITESKRRYSDDGRHHYEKHKLFLYKEDFEKFIEGLHETVERIEALRNNQDFEPHHSQSDDHENNEVSASEPEEKFKENGTIKTFNNIDFDDLED